uniref:HEAT repeat-containing protein 1 n=1 Tax=Scleropages formosus TaxID=113540 RepID=A0A8C9RF00_SCLFO
MTSLAHQLKRLALPQNDPSLLSRKDVASLLFDPKEAASIDRDTFFALGCTGLEELLGIESAFEEFQETLFSQASKGLERSVQTKEVNQKLDASISLFLTRLSPYFLLKPAQKCIEWLIHRFHIHQYNQDSLIACSLPYHETKVFVRVIQLLKIKDPTHRWNWLQCLQKPGVPLARGTLITHCYKDLGFMDFICSLVTKSVKVCAYSHSGENCPQLRVIFSFYASTIIPALDAVEKVTDALVAKLLPYVQKGLKSSLVDYKAATYMIVCQLAVKVVMESHLVDTLALQISKSVVKTPTLPREGLGSLIVLLQNQKAESISEKAFGYLSAIPTLVPTLKDIASVYDIGPLLRCLLPHLVRFVVTDKGRFLMSGTTILFIFRYFCQDVHCKFLPALVNCDSPLPLSRYPGALDVVLEGHVSDISNKEEQNLFHQFISLSLSSGKYKIIPESDTTLLLGLNHPLPSVRNLALEHLKEILRTGQAGFDEDFLREAVLERLRDDVPEVVLAALKAMQVMKFLSAEDMVSSLLSLFQRTDVSKAGNWFPVLKEAMRVLDNTHLLEEIPTLRNRVVTELLPFLVITCPYENLPEYQVASCVARSSLISQHPLTQGWSQALEDVMARTCPSDVMGVANQQLISTMTKNLLGMEASSKRSCVSNLKHTRQAGCLSFLGLRGRTSETWWNPEKLDNTTCCYLRLLIRLFEMTIAGASQGPLAPGFRALMRLLFQVHLSELPELFGFLSLLWGYGWSQSDQLDHRVGAVLQTQALYVGRALLSSQNGKNLKLLTSATSPVVPSLLMCLGSPVREVRRAAVAALQELGGADASPFHLVTKKLLQETEELITDPSHVSQALGKMYEEAIAGKGKAQDKKMIASVDQLLGCVQSPDCPSYTARALLQLLREVNGEAVLEVLLPAMERLLDQSGPDGPTFLKDEALLLQFLLTKYNEQSAPLLARHKGSLECFIRATGTLLEPFPGMPSFQLVALEQITKPFFAALGDEKVQQRLLAVMFDLLVDCKNPVCAQTINGVFKSITVDGELVAAEFGPVDRPKVSGSVHQTRRSKMLHRKAQDSASGPPDGISAVPWQRVTLILELLQHKKKLKRPQKLVPTLFSLLSRSLEPVQDDVTNLEYTKQLILSCLLNVCYKLSPDGALISKDVLEEEKFNVELVVQCLRGSGMPQTHHHALLLLGTMARIFPEKVLHNIMPIFTFMGANVMRLDDAYSFQVISKTVQMVIPALIKGGPSQLPGRTESMETVVIRVVHVFVDALPHVPEHRRRPVLAGLMTTLGAGHFLWVLLLLLFKQHAMQATSADAGETALQRDVEFWISVCCEFEVPEQLLSLFKILKYLSRLPEDKEDGEKKEGTDTLLFNVEMHSGKELRHYKFLSLSFLSQLLASDGFVGKVGHLAGPLLEEILCYINSVARCVEANANKPTAKFWRAMLNKSYDVLDKVIALLPTDTFITVMRGLMANKLPSVRRKAMELLNNKLQQKTVWNNDQVCVLLNLTKDLLSIVSRGQHEDDEEEEEQAINRQTALYSLKLLCRSFGASHQEAFVPVLHGAMELVTSPHEDRNVMGSALLCIAEVTSALKALAVPQLPRLMPAVLQTLKERKELFSNKVYLLSAVTALQRVSETLPHFISPYLKDILLQVHLNICTKCPQLPVRLASLRATLATKVPSRVLLPAVTMCYSQVAQSQQNRLGPLMDILKDHIVHMERDELTGHQSELTSFFLTALDFRSQHSQKSACALLHCSVKLVFFHPIQLFDWSKTEGAPKDRLLTFCRLADSIADKLKGLFVLFAGHLVKPFADLLNQTNVTKTDEAFFDSDDNVEKTCLLLQYVLDCLHKIFLYDTKHFVSKERADTLMAPLVDQLENTLGGVEVYHARVTEHLVPCIAQFSIAVRDDSQWKPLNYQVLLKTRHSSPKVRFSSLLMLVELAGKLKENYMVLLPETIPFLAELMEDECEEVEHQVQKVIHEMEVILGESLQSYF